MIEMKCESSIELTRADGGAVRFTCDIAGRHLGFHQSSGTVLKRDAAQKILFEKQYIVLWSDMEYPSK